MERQKNSNYMWIICVFIIVCSGNIVNAAELSAEGHLINSTYYESMVSTTSTLISGTLNNSITELNASFSINSTIYSCTLELTFGDLYSDADLHVYDELGRHTGFSYLKDVAETQIPDSTYTGREAYKEYIFINNSDGGNHTYTVVVRAIEVPLEGLNTKVYLTKVPRRPATLGIFPIEDYRIIFDEGNATFVIEIVEYGGQQPIFNVSINHTSFIRDNETIINKSSITLNNYSINILNPRESKFITVKVQVLPNTSYGFYIGEISAFSHGVGTVKLPLYLEVLQCTNDSDCSYTQFCNTSQLCEDKKPINSTCYLNNQCLSGHCVHNVCRASDPYCGDLYCDAGEHSTNCPADCNQTLKQNGENCTQNSECQGNYCVHNICRSTPTYCGDNYCDSGESCSSCPQDCGTCSPPGSIGGRGGGGGTTPMPIAIPPGEPECETDVDCSAGQICKDGGCVGGPSGCVNDADCPENQICEDGKCVEKPECTTDDDCKENQICKDGKCMEKPKEKYCGDGTCDPDETCKTCEEDCGSCVECGDGKCDDTENYDTCPRDCKCSADSDCKVGEVCSEGKCVKKPECTADTDCSGGKVCENGKCIEMPKDYTWLWILIAVVIIIILIIYFVMRKKSR